MPHKAPDQPRGRTFYATDDVLVTDSWLVVGQRRLLIRDLRHLQVAQARGSRTPAVLGVAGAVIPLFAALTGVGGMTSWLAITLGTGLVLGVAVWLRATESRHLVLHAEHRGISGPVFWSPDPRVFGQVTRAVLRAQEFALSQSRSEHTGIANRDRDTDPQVA